MPTANTDKLILAHLKNIRNALANPTTGAPVQAIHSTHTEQLTTITNILSNIIEETPMTPTAPKPKEIIQQTPAPGPNDEERTQIANIIPNDEPIEPQNHPDPAVRVPNQSENTSNPVPAVRVPQKTVTFANSTGPTAQNRRRRQRAITPPSNKKSKRNNPNKQPSTQQIHLAAHLDANFLHHALHGNAFNPDTNQLAKYPELAKCSEGSLWVESCKDKFGRLRIVAAYRPKKDNPRRIRFTVGGNLIHYLGQTSTKAANLFTVKLLINSTLSTPNAKFMTIDLKDLSTGQEWSRLRRNPKRHVRIAPSRANCIRPT